MYDLFEHRFYAEVEVPLRENAAKNVTCITLDDSKYDLLNKK